MYRSRTRGGPLRVRRQASGVRSESPSFHRRCKGKKKEIHDQRGGTGKKRGPRAGTHQQGHLIETDERKENGKKKPSQAEPEKRGGLTPGTGGCDVETKVIELVQSAKTRGFGGTKLRLFRGGEEPKCGVPGIERKTIKTAKVARDR